MPGEGTLRTRFERLADRRQQLQDEITETIRLVEADRRAVSPTERD